MKCKWCSIEFSPKHYNQKYCSKKCTNSFWGNNYYIKNKDKILKYNKTPEKRERDNLLKKQPHIKKHRAKYVRERRKTDPVFKLTENIYGRIRLDFPEVKKRNLTSLLGYSINDLWKFLSQNIDSKDYLNGKLELDHIIPYFWFIVLNLGDSEFKKCWSMKNLRLITKSENRRRTKKIDFNLLDQYNLYDILPCGADVIFKRHCPLYQIG